MAVRAASGEKPALLYTLLSCCGERTRRLGRDAWLTTAGVLLPMAYWVYYLPVE